MVKVTRSFTLVSLKELSLVDYTWQVWSLISYSSKVISKVQVNTKEITYKKNLSVIYQYEDIKKFVTNCYNHGHVSIIITEESPVEHIEQQMSALDGKVNDLQSENDDLKKEKNEAMSKVKEMELQLQQMKGQLDLQATLSTGLQDSEVGRA